MREALTLTFVIAVLLPSVIGLALYDRPWRDTPLILFIFPSYWIGRASHWVFDGLLFSIVWIGRNETVYKVLKWFWDILMWRPFK